MPQMYIFLPRKQGVAKLPRKGRVYLNPAPLLGKSGNAPAIKCRNTDQLVGACI